MRLNRIPQKKSKVVNINVEKQVINLVEQLSLDLIYPKEVTLNSKITSDLKFDATDREELTMSLEDLFDIDITNTKEFEDIMVKDIIILVKKQVQKELRGKNESSQPKNN